MIESYSEHLTKNVYEIIERYFKKNDDDEMLVKKHFTERLTNPRFKSFQDYYFLTLQNKEYLYSRKGFFKQFKQKYSLQGMDNNYLDESLEKHKSEMIKLLEEENLSELYFKYFFQIVTKHKNELVNKNFGSFFTKFVHTFNPDRYTAVDNPIKDYFKLEREGFFVSFIVISNAYYKWGADNKQRIESLKTQFKNEANGYKIKHDIVTDMKLLNLIFWSETNQETKEKPNA